MISSPKYLLFPFVLNILILVPVCYAMFLGPGTAAVFENKVTESEGLRLLVGSLWFAILVASVAGLLWPAFFAPIVIAQVIYKTLWLAAFVVPTAASGLPVPIGISAVFAFIVVTYPIAFWLALKPA